MVNKLEKPRWTSAAAKRLIKLAGNAESVDRAVQILIGQLLEGRGDGPVDLEKVAASLNVQKLYAADLPFSGELRRTNGAYEIAYGSHLSPERRRFTIAHELGHVLMERSGRGNPKFGAELERICDKLAAEILMPSKDFKERCGNRATVQTIVQLAKFYGTSLSSTAIRFAELFRVTVFEVNAEQVVWGFGIIRKGPLLQKDLSIRDAVRNILGTKENVQVFPYSTREWGYWVLEGQRLGANRGLFLFRPDYAHNRLSTAA